MQLSLPEVICYTWVSLVAQMVSDGKESAFNMGDTGSIPWLRRSPWRRKWQPTPVFLPGELIPWTEEPGGLQSMGLQSWTRLRVTLSHFTFCEMLTVNCSVPYFMPPF